MTPLKWDHRTKYAQEEIERRFLLSELPDDLDRGAYTQISDRYIRGARLRLRVMTNPDGDVIERKLGQIIDHPDDPTVKLITNTYLNHAEWLLLTALPADELTKRRYRYDYRGIRYSVDVFDAPHDGLMLLECEQFDGQTIAGVDVVVPPQVIREVTGDRTYSGGVLANRD